MSTSGLRIAVASSGLGHVARGIEAWAADLAAALNSRGESVSLFQGGGEPIASYARVLRCWQRDCSIVNRGWFPRRLLWRFGYGSAPLAEQTTFANSLVQVLKREPFDILHVQDPHVAFRVQNAIPRTRVILAHGTEEPDHFLKRIRFVQHLAPWHSEQARLRGCDDPAWTAIPNFIDTDVYCPGSSTVRHDLGISESARVILTAAAIKRHHKRIDYLIDEVARVPDVILIVAGGSEYETESVIAEGTAKLGDRVRFLVKYPRSKMPDLYRAANVFVLASHFEMMPIALVEACASGLPCITHDHPVMRWMTGPGGMAIDLAKPGALADALTGDVSALGPKAREHCLANFSTDSVVDQIVDHYRFVTRSA
jgi:1,2-diacylglycerol 3-alpha-glucosyltransferase